MTHLFLMSCLLVWLSIDFSQSINSREVHKGSGSPLFFSSAYLYVPRSGSSSDYNYHGCASTYEDPDGDCIVGAAGRDYPVYSSAPLTRFSCRNHLSQGYYADIEARCQAYHICENSGRQHTQLCPNGTLFNQEVMVCDWWYNVDCSSSGHFYGINDYIYRVPEFGNIEYDVQDVSRQYGVRGYGSFEVVTSGPEFGPTSDPQTGLYSREFVTPRAPGPSQQGFLVPPHPSPPSHHDNFDSFDSFELEDSIHRPTHKIIRQTTYKVSSKNPTNKHKGKN